jgi:hypothetical protein
MACEKCNNGYIKNELGMLVKCSCMIESPIKKNEVVAGKPIYHVTNAQKEVAIRKKLIPEARQDDEFDEQLVKAAVEEMCIAQGCKVKNFKKYIDTLNEIIVGISTNTLRKSYIIGAPDGFGKVAFVTTCIKRLDAMGKKAVPYISLFELGELRMEYEKRILGYLTNPRKAYKDEEDEKESWQEEEIQYTWSDYMKADVLFTYLTTLENKKAEVKLLKAIIDIRGPKGLPTIVFTWSSLIPYLNDLELKRYVWDEILSYNDEKAGCDRLIHRSCFKIYNSEIKATAGEDY